MVANDDHAPLARRAGQLLRVHSQDVVMLSPLPLSRERKETVEAIARALRRRRRYFTRGVGGLAVLVIAVSAAAVLFAR